MAKCAICEKGAHFGNNVSHSHRKTPKMWKSNVKYKVEEFTGMTVNKINIYIEGVRVID